MSGNALPFVGHFHVYLQIFFKYRLNIKYKPFCDFQFKYKFLYINTYLNPALIVLGKKYPQKWGNISHSGNANSSSSSTSVTRAGKNYRMKNIAKGQDGVMNIVELAVVTLQAHRTE